MQFRVRPLDGGPARVASKLAFADRDGTLATLTLDRPGGLTVWEKRTDTDRTIDGIGIDPAAELVAQLLHRYREASLVVYTTPGSRLRGDETETADVYPPSKQPRIDVQR